MNATSNPDEDQIAPTRIITDYDQYDIRRFEGSDTELSELDFLPAAEKPKASSIYQPPRKQNAWFAMIFMAIALGVSIVDWQGGFSESLAISQRDVFVHGKWWQAITALFLHADIVHLLSNGWLLVLFGWILKDFGTALAFPVLALVVGVATNFATVLTMPAHHRLLGASGMVYGMVAMWIVFYLYYSEAPPKLKWMGAIAFILIVMFPDTFNPQVSYAAHGIGFVIGLIVGALYCLVQPKR